VGGSRGSRGAQSGIDLECTYLLTLLSIAAWVPYFEDGKVWAPIMSNCADKHTDVNSERALVHCPRLGIQPNANRGAQRESTGA
jgi:hypothetical protein